MVLVPLQIREITGSLITLRNYEVIDSCVGNTVDVGKSCFECFNVVGMGRSCVVCS